MRTEPGSPVFTLPESGVLAAGVPMRCMEDAHAESVRLECRFSVTDGSSTLGPLLWCRASLVLPGLRTLVIFRDRPRREARFADEATRPIDLMRPGERVAPRLGRPLRSIRGPSMVSIRVTDFQGWTLAEEREIGPCVDGVLEAQASFLVDVKAMVWLAARGWAECGPRIGVSGEVTLPRGVAMRIAFRPLGSDRSVVEERAVEVPIVRPGVAWYTSERIVEGRSPEHAWVFVQFREAGTRVVSAEQIVGRCVLIQPGRSAVSRPGR